MHQLGYLWRDGMLDSPGRRLALAAAGRAGLVVVAALPICPRSMVATVAGRLVRGPVKTVAGIRVLPLVPLTRAALLTQRAKQGEQRAAAGTDWQETGYVFTTCSGRPVEPRNLSRSFDRIVAAADLPRIVFHDLRRTAATLLKDLGVPARDVQVVLGHANIAVTLGIYSEVFDTEITSALARMNDALDAGDNVEP